MEVGNDSKRYYPSPMEQSILVQNVGNYFSKPERSVERNKIAADVSAQLTKINPHWSHRAVRLWFNNNKHTYNGETPQTINPNPAQPLSMSHQHVHFGDPTYNPNSQVGMPNPAMQSQQPQQMAAMPLQPVMPPSMNLNPQLQQTQQIQQMQQAQQSQQIQQIQQTQQMQQMQQVVQQTQPPQQINQMIMNTPVMQIPPSPMQSAPVSQQIIQQKPQKMTPPQGPIQSQYQPNYQQVIKKLIKDSTQVGDEEMPQIVQKYDHYIKEMRSTGQTAPIPFSINPKNTVVVSQSDPPEFSFSNSGISVQDSTFQTRRYNDLYLFSQFDATFVDKSCAAFVHMARMSPERALSYEFVDSPKFGADWLTQKVNKTARIEEIVVDSEHKCAWMLGNSKMLRLHLDPNQKLQSVDLSPNNNSRYPANLVVLKGHVVTGYPDSNILYFVDSRMKVTQVATSYPENFGFSTICTMNDSLLCGLTQSHAVRLINENGSEIRSFIGHTETVIQISKMGDETFLTASDDRSLNLWDIRQHAPIGHIGTNSKSIVAISGCPDFAVFATHSNQINAFDVKGVPMKSVVCVSTDEYQTSNLFYNPENDSLCLFGIAAKDGNSDSLLFIDDEGSSRKYIFRRYQNFIHL